jgi:hypothetical protein
MQLVQQQLHGLTLGRVEMELCAWSMSTQQFVITATIIYTFKAVCRCSTMLMPLTAKL